jgi:hypothetical protein
MNRCKLLALTVLFSYLANTVGCSLCCNPYLDDYVAFGSRTPRMDMKRGRVGSILSESMGNADEQAYHSSSILDESNPALEGSYELEGSPSEDVEIQLGAG